MTRVIRADPETPKRPVLRYHGGKFNLAPWIATFFPPHRTYVEPYGGAGSLLFHKERSYCEIYNDLDGRLVQLFKVLRDPVQSARLRELVELTPYARAEFELTFQEPTGDPIEDSRRLIVRCFQGFNSAAGTRRSRTGYRLTVSRRGTHSAIDWARWPEEIPFFYRRLQGVALEQVDALSLIERLDEQDALFYVDPPYLGATRASPEKGYRFDMRGPDDHRRLAAALHNVRGMVVLSGYASALYDEELYADWERHARDTYADCGQPRTDVVWLNPACSVALRASRTQHEFILEGRNA